MEVLEGMKVLKGAEVLKSINMNGSTKRTERTGRTENLRAGVCNEWIINKGWACFLYIVYILWAHNKGL